MIFAKTYVIIWKNSNGDVEKMRYIYKVRQDVLETEEARYTVYGIDVIHNSDVVRSVSNLFCDRENAENFAKFCSSENIPPEEIEDIAAEILDRPERNFRFSAVYDLPLMYSFIA